MAGDYIFYQLPFLPPAWSAQLKANTLLTLLLLVITLMLFLFILLSRLRDGFRFANKRWMTKKSQQFITAYMFNEDLNQRHVERFRQKHLVNNSRCQIFTDTLLELHKNIVGEFSDRLRLLYLQMGLHVHSKQKMYAGSWNIIADGINELAEMDMQQDINLVRSFINHHHPELRSVAQVAYLKLQRDAPFAFLDELQEPLREWQQMQLASAAHKAYMRMPDFKRWLSKDEISIVTFCIRMIALHNQHHAAKELVELLGHPDRLVRTETIKAIRVLEMYEAKNRLLLLYEQEATDLKLEIIKALAVIGDDELLPFYEQVMAFSEKRLQLAAAKAMALIGQAGKEALKQIKDDLENALQPIAASALDDRL